MNVAIYFLHPVCKARCQETASSFSTNRSWRSWQNGETTEVMKVCRAQKLCLRKINVLKSTCEERAKDKGKEAKSERGQKKKKELRLQHKAKET